MPHRFPPTLPLADQLRGVRDAMLMTTPDKDDTAWAVLTRAIDALIAARFVAAQVGDFLQEEADNRSAAGSEMSDYEREPRELVERVDVLIGMLKGGA